MKNIILSALLCIGTLAAQAQEEFTIRGNVKGVKDGTVVHLFRQEGQVGKGVGRDTIRNGSFLLKGKAQSNEVEKYNIVPFGEGCPTMGLDLWILPKSDILITGENNYIYTWKATNPIEQQKIRTAFVENAHELWNEFQRLLVERNTLMENAYKNGSLTEEAKKILRAQSDSLQCLMDEVDLQITARDIELMKQLPVSEVWLERLLSMAWSVTYKDNFPYKDEAIAFYNNLTEEQKNSEKGKTIYTCLFPPTIVEEGDEMADADLYDLEGNIHHLADFKGKYILLDIWSSGCGPCIMALPEMKEISEQYKDKLAVVSLSTDRKDTWERASKTHQMTWNNLNDLQGQNGLYAKYGVRGIPNYILISPEGKVIKKWMGYGKGSLHVKMRRLLNSDKHIMSVSEADGKKIVTYPSVSKANIDFHQIKQVELTDTATIVRMHAYHIPNYWIKVSRTITLIADGKEYPLKRAEGITLDKEFYMPESGEAEYTFYFEPMPQTTKTFDMVERAGDNPDKMEGILLVMPEK